MPGPLGLSIWDLALFVIFLQKNSFWVRYIEFLIMLRPSEMNWCTTPLPCYWRHVAYNNCSEGDSKEYQFLAIWCPE